MPELSNKLRDRLLEASEILHSHKYTTFHQRLFEAAHLVFEESCLSFELYGRTGEGYEGHTDIPFEKARKQTIMQRLSELVPVQHPVMPSLLAGETSPMRLSDFLTFRQFRRTDLFHDIFKPVQLKHQMVIPAHTLTHSGGLTINRISRDFTAEEVSAAVVFSRHLVLAFDTNQLLQQTAPAKRRLSEKNFTKLRRLGLTRRECEVLWWIAQGKRDAEIAIILGISRRTASHHAENIFAKLRVETRTAAIAASLEFLKI